MEQYTVYKKMEEEVTAYFELAVEASTQDLADFWQGKACAIIDFTSTIGVITKETADEYRYRLCYCLGYKRGIKK